MSQGQECEDSHHPLVFEILGDSNVERVARAIGCVTRSTANVWLRYLAHKTSMKLHERGLGYKKIARIIEGRFGYSISSGVIVNWMGDRYNPLGRHKLPQMSHQDVYVLAAAIGDGTSKFDIERGGSILFQHLKDRDFAEMIAKYSRSKVRVNKSHGYDAIVRNTVLADLTLAGKRDPIAVYPLLQLHPTAAVRGFFDAEGGVDPTHGVPRAYNTDKEIIGIFSSLLDELSIHHTLTSSRMRSTLMNPRGGKVYLRKALLKYGISVSSCCMRRFDAIVSFTIGRKKKMLTRMVNRRQNKQLGSCSTDLPPEVRQSSGRWTGGIPDSGASGTCSLHANWVPL